MSPEEVLIPAHEISDWDFEPRIAKCLSIGGRCLVDGVSYKATGWIFYANN